MTSQSKTSAKKKNIIKVSPPSSKQSVKKIHQQSSGCAIENYFDLDTISGILKSTNIYIEKKNYPLLHIREKEIA